MDQELCEKGIDFSAYEDRNNTWLSSVSDYAYHGKTYVVRTLTAQPKNDSSGLKQSKSIAVKDSDIDYTYAFVETVTFKYVKIKGQPDSKQKLAYVSTRGVAKVGYQYPEFDYTDGMARADVVQGKYTITDSPDGYNSISRAVKAYLNVNAPFRAWTDCVRIEGIYGEKVARISPVRPEFPAQIN